MSSKSVIDEPEFWELNIKDEAMRAGLDPSGTVGCATLHMIGEKVVSLTEELQGKNHTRLDQLEEDCARTEKLLQAMTAKVEMLKPPIDMDELTRNTSTVRHDANTYGPAAREIREIAKRLHLDARSHWYYLDVMDIALACPLLQKARKDIQKEKERDGS